MNIAEHIIVRNKNNGIVAYLSPNDGIKDASVDKRQNGESTLEFKIPTNSEKWNEITPECSFEVYGRKYILLRDEAIDTERTDKGTWGIVRAVESWYELDFDYAEPYIDNSNFITSYGELSVIIVSGGSNLSGGLYQTGTAKHALYALLQGTGWTVGTVDVVGIHDLETDKESILSNIKKVQEVWGGLLVWDSINKTVSLRDELTWKPYNGFQIRYAKNLKHITKTQSNRLVTKLYPFGKDDLDIAIVNGGKKYIEDYSYTSKIYIDKYINAEIETAEELKAAGEIELAKRCRPRDNYKANIVDLRTLPEYNHEDFSVGDMADIIDLDMNINVRSRLLRHKFEVFQPWKCELEIGDPENRFLEDLKKAFDNTYNVNKFVAPTAQSALEKILAMSEDNKLTPNEKISIQKELDLIIAEKSNLDSRADLYSVSKVAYGTAYNNLMTYINALLADMGSTSTIDRVTFNSKFTNYYNARTALLNSILDAIKAVADSKVGPEYGKFTQISPTGIYTGTLTAGQINAISGIRLGAGAVIDWTYVGTPTAAQVGARPDTWIPTASQVGALASNSPRLTYIDQYGAYFGTIEAENILAGTLTGFLIKTASSGQRLELGGTTLTSYGSNNKKNGASIYTSSEAGTNALSIWYDDVRKADFFYDVSSAKAWLGSKGVPLKIFAGWSGYEQNMSISAANIFMEGNVDFNGATVAGLKAKLG